MTNRSRRAIRSVAGIAAFVVLAGSITGVAFWDASQPSADPGPQPPGRVVDVRLQQAEVTLACAPGIVDPAGPQPLEALPELWQPSGELGVQAADLSGGGTALRIPSEALQDASYGAATLVGQTQGELASFLLEGCLRPGRDLVLPAGSTEIGEDTVLILSNPNSKPVAATVQVLTAIGPGLAQPMEITVPAQSTVSVLPAIWAPGENRIGLRVHADGMGVGAWLQSSGLDGEVPLGLGRVHGINAHPDQVLVGIDPAQAQTLRVANVGTEPTGVRIRVVTDDGTADLGGTDGLEIEAQGVFDIDMVGLDPGALALLLQADQPIAASVLQEGAGAPFPEDPSLDVSVRSFVPTSEVFSVAVVPPLDRLKELVGPFGLTDVTASVVLANQSDQEVVVQVGKESVRVEANSAKVVPLPSAGEGDQVTIAPEQPLHGSLVVRAQGESGLMTSVMDLRQDVASSVERQVRVVPSHRLGGAEEQAQS